MSGSLVASAMRLHSAARFRHCSLVIASTSSGTALQRLRISQRLPVRCDIRCCDARAFCSRSVLSHAPQLCSHLFVSIRKKERKSPAGASMRVDDLEPPVAERPPASLTLPPFDGAFFFESRLNSSSARHHRTLSRAGVLANTATIRTLGFGRLEVPSSASNMVNRTRCNGRRNGASRRRNAVAGV